MTKLDIGAVDSTNEGGEIHLRGAPTFKDWGIDSYQNKFRIFSTDNAAYTNWYGAFVIDGANGNVGIGTASPVQKLHIEGSTRVQTTMPTIELNETDSGGNQFNIQVDAGIMSMGRWNLPTTMNLDAGGNVGIGTTAPGANLSFGTSAGLNGLWLYEDAGGASGFGISSNTLNTYTSGTTLSFGHYNKTGPVYTPWMNVVNGSIGIGTTNPGGRLHVYAPAADTDLARIPAASEVALATGNGDGSTSSWIWREMWAANNWGIFHDNTADKMHVVGNNTARLTVDLSGGNVGIGTIAPTRKLTVHGGGLQMGIDGGTYSGNGEDLGIYLTNPNANAGSPTLLHTGGRIYSKNSSTGGWENQLLVLEAPTSWNTWNANQLVLSGAGNVGIGTTGPVALLDVRGKTLIGGGGTVYPNLSTDGWNPHLIVDNGANSQGIAAIRNDASTYGGVLVLGKGRSSGVVQNGDRLGEITFAGHDGTDWTNSGAIIRTIVDGTPGTDDLPSAMTFFTSPDGSKTPAERLRIDNAGNVGIGMANPVEKLQLGNGIAFHNGGDKILAFGYSPSTENTLMAGNPAEVRWSSASGLLFATDGTTRAAGAAAGLSYRMTIANDGKVGIGVGPLTSFHVGDLWSETYNATFQALNWWGIAMPDAGYAGSADGRNHYMIGRGAGHADRRLTVHVPSYATYGSTGTHPSFTINSTGAVDLVKVLADTGDTYIKGNVGVGTTVPATRLDVAYNDNNFGTGLTVRNSNAGGNAQVTVSISPTP